MTTRHVIGMAKSNLDSRGAKGPKLELYFLRLVYAVRELQRCGEYAHAYLCVMTNDVAKRVECWASKYNAIGLVEVIVAQLSDDEMNDLQAEKLDNVRGMIDGSSGRAAGGRSIATKGAATGEPILRTEILSRHIRLSEVSDVAKFPLRIRWDFYATSDA